MRWADKLRLRLRSLFSRPRLENELDSELRFHLEQQIEENLAAGMSPDEAGYSARRSIGGIAQITEECRDMRGVGQIQNLLRDLRYAARMLRNSPGFTSVAVLSLAIAIGANAAVFSLIDDLLLRAVNVADPETLVSLHRILPRGGTAQDFSMPVFEEIRDHNRAFSGTVGFSWSQIGVSINGAPAEMVGAGFYSGNYFPVLGVRPLLGRTFSPDDKAGANAVALMSYSYWTRQFSADPLS